MRAVLLLACGAGCSLLFPFPDYQSLTPADALSVDAVDGQVLDVVAPVDVVDAQVLDVGPPVDVVDAQVLDVGPPVVVRWTAGGIIGAGDTVSDTVSTGPTILAGMLLELTIGTGEATCSLTVGVTVNGWVWSSFVVGRGEGETLARVTGPSIAGPPYTIALFAPHGCGTVSVSGLLSSVTLNP